MELTSEMTMIADDDDSDDDDGDDETRVHEEGERWKMKKHLLAT